MIQDKARKATHPSPHPAAHVKVNQQEEGVKPVDPLPNPNPYAICQVRNGHCLINATPSPSCEPFVCPKCRVREPKKGLVLPVAYAHKLNRRAHCDECEGDRIAAIGIALERQGINLGWGVLDHTREYEREAHQQWRAR